MHTIHYSRIATVIVMFTLIPWLCYHAFTTRRPTYDVEFPRFHSWEQDKVVPLINEYLSLIHI